MGTWTFIFAFLLIMIIWMGVNTVLLGKILHHHQFDVYPFVLLNLLLSTMAGLQAAALLIAAKRADAVSAQVAIHTENNTEDIKTLLAENTQLTTEVKKNTDLLDEIHRHVTALSPIAGAFPPKDTE